MPTNLGDDEIEQYIAQTDNSLIDKWSFMNEFVTEVFVDLKLCVRLNRLGMGETIFHYKINYYKYNFQKMSESQAIQVNAITGTKRILNKKVTCYLLFISSFFFHLMLNDVICVVCV